VLLVAVFLTLLTLALLWFTAELFRGNPFAPIDAPREQHDGLGSLRAVTVLVLVGAAGSAFHLWTDRVHQYSEEEVREIVSDAVDELDRGDDSLPQVLEASGDLDGLRVLSARGDADDLAAWLVTDDDGGSPHCVWSRISGPQDDEERWFYSSGVC
jgi:hypothetical protein